MVKPSKQGELLLFYLIVYFKNAKKISNKKEITRQLNIRAQLFIIYVKVEYFLEVQSLSLFFILIKACLFSKLFMNALIKLFY